MHRRDFLTAGAGALAVAASTTRVARTQQARQPDPAKLERIAIMTLDFGALLKLPNQPASPARTLEVFDIPEMLADVYGVHNVEFQHTHIASTERSYLQDLRARLERSKSRMTNLNLEFGPVNVSAEDPAQRQQADQLVVGLEAQQLDLVVGVEHPERREQVPAFVERVGLGGGLRQRVPALDLGLAERTPVAPSQFGSARRLRARARGRRDRGEGAARQAR